MGLAFLAALGSCRRFRLRFWTQVRLKTCVRRHHSRHVENFDHLPPNFHGFLASKNQLHERAIWNLRKFGSCEIARPLRNGFSGVFVAKIANPLPAVFGLYTPLVNQFAHKLLPDFRGCPGHSLRDIQPLLRRIRHAIPGFFGNSCCAH